MTAKTRKSSDVKDLCFDFGGVASSLKNGRASSHQFFKVDADTSNIWQTWEVE